MSYDLEEKKIEDELDGQEAKDFRMKYKNEEDVQHLISILEEKHRMKVDMNDFENPSLVLIVCIQDKVISKGQSSQNGHRAGESIRIKLIF